MNRRASYRGADRAMLTRIASMAAREAVQQTFTNLGVDITTPAALIETQELFSSLRSLKRDWVVFRNRLITGAAGLVLAIVTGLVLHYFKAPPPI